ncbi:hypothetical protein [Hymenobacter guriensis]|uniref:DUF5723 domain-containing protein n=1 Tax=Hymenobacter guriensis TaxID=2793065 RepID=A0ABS0L1Y3_9BACT|nr:hypothetical protein [Hymenobacter guriensis]MBG8554119.1 hypothetical protein [Hymenobacter guriensis]
MKTWKPAGWCGVGGALLGLSALLAAPAAAQDIATLDQQKPVTLSGTLDVRGIFYQAQGIEARRKPFSYVLAGSPTLSIYGIAVPVSFVLSEQDRRFRQPFNQFGLSPTYKWVTVHAGYRNLTFSPFTLAGHTVLGGGVELNPGKLRFASMVGRFSRATSVDPVSGSLMPFSFSRKGYAGKLGFGTEKSFIDLSLVRARDDSSSVSRETRQLAETTGAANNRVLPAANLVLGLSGRLTIKKDWLLEADGGLSFFTRDVGSSLAVEEALPKALRQPLSKLIAVNGSTEAYTAWQAAAGYQHNGNGLKVRYRRVSPGFQSMGAYYFQDDVQNLTLVPTLTLWQQKLRLTGSVGIQQDNLREQKQLTSRRLIGSLNASAEFTERLGLDVSYTNYTTDQQPGAVQVADTFRLTQTQQSLSVAPRYTYAGETWGHTVLLSADRAILRDQSPDELGKLGEFTSYNAFLSYQLTWVPRRFSVGATYNYTQLKLATGDDGNHGLQLNADQAFGQDGQVRLGVRGSLLRSLRADQPSRLVGGGLRAAWRVSRHHTFRTDVVFTGHYPTGDETTQNRRYSETSGEIGYAFTL